MVCGRVLAASLLLAGAALIVAYNIVSNQCVFGRPNLQDMHQPQASIKTMTHVTSPEDPFRSGILDQIPGGTMWRHSNECMHGGGRYQNISRERERNGEVLRETAPLRWLQLEERLRSLDAYLDAHRGSNQEWKFPPTNSMKHTRENGIFMTSYKDKIKAKNIWETLHQNQSNRMNSFCEIGINLGHSTLLWLEANPVGCVYVFDLPDEAAFEPRMKYTIQYLKLVYTERIVIVQGDHKDTIPAFAERSKVKCDSISIDGPKGEEGRELDFRLFQSLAHQDTLLFIDDVAPEEVVNFAVPSTNLRESEQVARRWIETGKIEVLKLLALPWARRKSWISDGVPSDSPIYPSDGCGHGTLVARYTGK